MTFPLNLTDNAFTQKQQLQECVQLNGSQTFPTANNDIYPSFKTLPLVIFSKIKNLVWRICILLSIQIFLPNPNFCSPEPAATSTNPFLQDAVYDSTGAAQSGEVKKLLSYVLQSWFVNFYMIFICPWQEGQYYGRGYTQAQSGYSASGLGY